MSENCFSFFEAINLCSFLQDLLGKEALAAGWGLYEPQDERDVNVTGKQWGMASRKQGTSTILRQATLNLSDKKYKHTKMFGTKVDYNNVTESSTYQHCKDVCSGDSGYIG